MAISFKVPDNVISSVLNLLKKSNLVHPQATFNFDADEGYRKEIAYRDIDFLDRIGRKEYEDEIVDSALDFLKKSSFVEENAYYDKNRVTLFREYLKQKLVRKSWTSVSPAMERLFYMLTSVKRPQNMIELGCFWGNTLAWFASPCLGPNPQFKPERIIGIDIDAKVIAMARENFKEIENSENVQIINEDARITLNSLEGKFDFVYIESKADNQNDLYLPLLKLIYDKIPKGGWVMAHDATRFTMQDDLKDYLKFVRNKENFEESITFDIDSYGLELSIK